jgi:hypothetical protein
MVALVRPRASLAVTSPPLGLHPCSVQRRYRGGRCHELQPLGRLESILTDMTLYHRQYKQLLARSPENAPEPKNRAGYCYGPNLNNRPMERR